MKQPFLKRDVSRLRKVGINLRRPLCGRRKFICSMDCSRKKEIARPCNKKNQLTNGGCFDKIEKASEGRNICFKERCSYKIVDCNTNGNGRLAEWSMASVLKST